MAKPKITYIPQSLDLVLYAGDGTNFRLVVTDGNSAPVNLTGTMRAQIRKTRDEPDPPDAAFTIDLTRSAEGIVVLTLTGEQTQTLAITEKYSGAWDLEWTATDAEPMTLCQGAVECYPDVSH